MQIVQFAGQCVSFNDGQEWHVTHAVISNSLEVLEPAARAAHNRSVEELIRSENLTHIGWLRQASAACPLSSLDMDTQRVRSPLGCLHTSQVGNGSIVSPTSSAFRPCCFALPLCPVSKIFPCQHVLQNREEM